MSISMRWIVVCCLVVAAFGCSRARTELVEITPEDARVDALELTEPSGTVPAEEFAAPAAAEPTPAPQEDVEDYVKAAQRMLREGDFATASLLLQDAFKLDPNARSVRSLQAKLDKAQRQAEEQARRELISLYEREGREILEQGDDDRALAYFHAAQALDPTNRKPFTLIQQAHATWDKLRARQREEAFNARLRPAKAIGQAEVRTEAASPLEEWADIPAVPGKLEPRPQVEQAAALPMPQAVLPSEATGHPVEVVPTAQPFEASTDPSAGEYTVQSEDVLKITVFEEPDLATTARVTSSGEITFPLLGRVAIAGLTVTQVQEKLTTLLAADYLVNPQVQVFSDTTLNARKVFVTGAVNKPGSYTIPTERSITVMETIAMAGGFSEEASPNKTRIVRVEDGQDKTILVRANDIVKKGDKTQDATVRPNDIIFVPESFF